MANPVPWTEIDLAPQTLERLRHVSTASLATQLFKRGFPNCFVQGVSPLAAGQKLVGPAFTLRYIPAREDTDPIEAFRERDHPQRVAIETCPEGAVLVMDCRQDASAASAGSILLTRLQVRGGAGVVTDGGIRDATNAARLDMPVFAAKASAPTNLTKHHAVDIDVPIGCGGVAVYPGDIVVGDDDGVMADEVAEDGMEMEAFEAFVMEEVLAGRPVIGLYPPTDKDAQDRYHAYREEKKAASPAKPKA